MNQVFNLEFSPKDAATFVLEIMRQQENAEQPNHRTGCWIDASGNVPKSFRNVLVYRQCNGTRLGVDIAYRQFNEWHRRGDHDLLEHVTHWMTLPEPPEGA